MNTHENEVLSNMFNTAEQIHISKPDSPHLLMSQKFSELNVNPTLIGSRLNDKGQIVLDWHGEGQQVFVSNYMENKIEEQ